MDYIIIGCIVHGHIEYYDVALYLPTSLGRATRLVIQGLVGKRR